MCVTSLLGGLRADLRPFYGLYSKRFSLYKPLYREKTVYSTTIKDGHKSAHGPHRRDVTHILCKMLFFIEILSFS